MYAIKQFNTQALTEKFMVCWSNRKEVGVEAVADDVPGDLVVEPT